MHIVIVGFSKVFFYRIILHVCFYIIFKMYPYYHYVITFKRGRRVLGGAARTADLLWNVSVVLVGRSGSVVLCTAGLEDMAVALSPGKCGSYRQILSNNSVSRWLRCRVNQTREIGPTRLSNALTSCSTSLILGTSTTICKTSKCGRGQPITLPLLCRRGGSVEKL